MTASLQRSYRHAEHTTAVWARSFHFASRFLPLEKKRAIFALYDYCRHADNLVDERGDRPGLRSFGRTLPGSRAKSRPCTPAPRRRANAGWRWRTRCSGIRFRSSRCSQLLDGVAMDLEPVEIQDFAMLHRYCRHVAGGVGLMLGPVLGAAPVTFREAGVRLGIAMQLTNVLRDVGEDLANGRVYLPADELAGFGLSRAALETRRVTPEFRRFMQWQVKRARRYFEDGGRVVPLFPNDGSRLTVRLLQRTYAGILDAIERIDYDVFRTRAYVSAPAKARGAGPRHVVGAAVDDVPAVRALRVSRARHASPAYQAPRPIAVWAFARYFRGLFRRHFASARWSALDDPAGWDHSVPVLFVSNHTSWWDGFFSCPPDGRMGTHLPHPDGGDATSSAIPRSGGSGRCRCGVTAAWEPGGTCMTPIVRCGRGHRCGSTRRAGAGPRRKCRGASSGARRIWPSGIRARSASARSLSDIPS